MIRRFITLFCALVFLGCGAWALAQDDDSHEGHDHAKVEEKDEHAGHDHGKAEEGDAQKEDDKDTSAEIDPHAGHDHAKVDDTGSDGASDGFVVELSPQAIKLAGIGISKVNHGQIDRMIELPGEVGFNEDRVAHISPRFAGIALAANYRVGDYVNEGDIVAVVESNESLNSYSVKAPMSGWIIQRHITSGEFVSEENSIYMIADLSVVWVNLAVYPKDVDNIRKGQVAEIRAIGSNRIAIGAIEYVTPIMDLQTRSVTARVTLPNPDNKWRPGTFVQAIIAAETGVAGLVVEKSAIQYLDEESVIFVVDGPNRFKPVVVIAGDSNHKYVQILSDLEVGTSYVSTGAFELKAKIVTSNIDPHAGHGH